MIGFQFSSAATKPDAARANTIAAATLLPAIMVLPNQQRIAPKHIRPLLMKSKFRVNEIPPMVGSVGLCKQFAPVLSRRGARDQHSGKRRLHELSWKEFRHASMHRIVSVLQQEPHGARAAV